MRCMIYDTEIREKRGNIPYIAPKDWNEYCDN